MAVKTYPPQFLFYIQIIIDNIEGGFSDHKADTGGKTMHGITERLARTHGYKGDMKHLSMDEAIDIYYEEFWKGKVSNHIKHHLAFHLFDCSINSGYSRAVKILQEALGLKADGLLGVDTVNAISQHTEKEIIYLFGINRMYFYSTLANYSTFGKGWRNRLLKLSNLDWELEAEKYE
ncbi:glycoside hydrolase family 108 protein [Wohlfahrtiimonas larvae]|uniref:Glycoside hydrolase family 108 protein n=1 Tax=Wohlfahrtiimonas larvae TaxID=1157986 RepID=A0ABP9MZS0_9GAMM|nr:glycosyl hydrolase 108 family protein [Wohlfahrtiimonas larvae]